MNIKDVKQILGKTEVLGLDAQPLRDLIKKIQSREVGCSEFERILVALDKTTSSGEFSPDSKPVQVQLLLKQIDKKLKAPRPKRSEVVYTESKGDDISESVNMEILNIVSRLSQDMSDIKNQKTQPVVIEKRVVKEGKIEVDEDAPALSGAFINPMIGQKDQVYKSNISIETKEGDNIGNKLSKLKKLKNKND